jgi:hypothetical protein
LLNPNALMTNDMWIANLQMVTSKYVEEFPFKLYEELSLQKFWWNILSKRPTTPTKMVRVSEWLLFNAISAILWREQVHFQWDDDEVRFVLDQHAELDFYSASSLKQQSVSRHIAPLGQIILILSQPVFAFSLMLRA